MAFSTRRGRPPRARLDDTDNGTPELQLKRALGVTAEPIDLCLERRLITPDQHWCGLHLRWLYTLRYGAPVITTRYADKDAQSTAIEDTGEWRALREREYSDAIAALKRASRYEPVMRLSVFNELPAFLNPAFIRRTWDEPLIAEQLAHHRACMVEGLDLLVSLWRTRSAKSV